MPIVKRVSLQKNIFGYGFALEKERPCVVGVVMPGSVASAANISCGDALLTVNGVNVSDLSHADVASLIWSAGSTITIEFLSHVEGSPTASNTSRVTHYTPPFDDLYMQRSPLFAEQTVASTHRKSAVVMFIGKVPIDVTYARDESYILQRIPFLLDKAESLVQSPNTSDAACLLEIFTDSLRIRLTSRAFQYPTNSILFSAVVNHDPRFFFLITRGHSKHLDVRVSFQTRSLRSRSARDCSAGPALVSCCVFRCLPPKLLGHRSHATLVKQFDLACHRDRLTGECAEFPRDSASIVSNLKELSDVWLNQDNALVSTSSPVDSHAQPQNTLDVSAIGCLFSTPLAPCSKPVTSSVFKRPGSVLRPSSSRLFGKLTKAAGYIRDRWNDRRNSSIQAPETPLERRSTMNFGLNQTVQSANPRHAAAAHKLSSSLVNLTENIPPLSRMACSSRSTVGNASKSDPSMWRTNFDRLLSDPVGLETFRAFLASEFSEENLEFWCVVRNWRLHYPGSRRAVKEAKKLFDTYLDCNSMKAVNVDSQGVKAAASQLSSPSPTMFVEAERQIYNLMKNDCYRRFLASDYYQSLLTIEPIQEKPEADVENKLPTEVTGRRMSIGDPEANLERSTPTRRAVGRKTQSVCMSPDSSEHKPMHTKSPVAIGSSSQRSSYRASPSLSRLSEGCETTPGPLASPGDPCAYWVTYRISKMANAGGFTQGLNKVSPPLRGSFPLDRKGLCKEFMKRWLDCISKNLGNSSLCRVEAGTYLKCRADHNLMAPEEPEYLGFSADEWDEIMKESATT